MKNLLAETRGRKCDECFWNGKRQCPVTFESTVAIDENFDNLLVYADVSSTSIAFDDKSTNPATIGPTKIPEKVATAAVNRTPLRELSNGRSPAHQQLNQSSFSTATYTQVSAFTPLDDGSNNIPNEDGEPQKKTVIQGAPASTQKKPSPVKLVRSSTKKKKVQKDEKTSISLSLFPSYILIGFTFFLVILLLCISKYEFAAKSLSQRLEYTIDDNRIILAAEGNKVEEEVFIPIANIVAVRQSQQQLSKLSVKNFVESLLNKINAILLLPSKILETILVSRTK